MYDYREHVTDDIREYIRDNVDLNKWKGRRDDLEEELRDDLWTADSVTGNASGSYFFSTWKAEEALCHNWDLLADALEEFGGDCDILRRGGGQRPVTSQSAATCSVSASLRSWTNWKRPESWTNQRTWRTMERGRGNEPIHCKRP